MGLHNDLRAAYGPHRAPWAVALGLALVLLLLVAPLAMAAPAAQDAEPTPIVLGQLARATLAAGESASWVIETPDSGAFLLANGGDDADAANFTIVITDEDGNELFNGALEPSIELELDEAEYTITATAAADGEVSLFLTGDLGELSEDYGEGELANGFFATAEDIDSTLYADVEIDDLDDWTQAFVVITGGEDDVYSAYISGENIYNSISDNVEEGALTFLTKGGDYTLEITPAEESGESLTVVLLLGGSPVEVPLEEETDLVLQPGMREVMARFTVDEANREYTVTLVGEDSLDVDMMIGVDPTQNTWSSYNSGTDEEVTFVAPVAGEYFIRATTGDAPDEAHPMVVLVEAGELSTLLTPGERVWGEVEEGGNVVYSLAVTEPNMLLTILLAGSNEQDLDLTAQQVGEDGSSLTSLSSYALGATEVLAATVTEPGTFQINVSGEYADDDTPFVLLVRLESAGDVGAQFATGAEASSQFGDDGYAPVQATGAPNVGIASDNPLAWASKDPDGGEESITLTYEHLVTPTGIRIYESFNPGAVVRVEVLDEESEEWVVLWEGQELTEETLRTFSPVLEQEELQTMQVRLTLDTASVPGWNEIDAVELLGVP